MTLIELNVATAGERLDKFLLPNLPHLSRMQVQTLIDDGHVTVNGKNIKAGIKVRAGDLVQVNLPEQPAEEAPQPQALALNIVYEDDLLAVIDKPAGLVVHPGVGNSSGTLVNALVARYPQLATTERKGIVHRLDKDTSGLLVIGKTEAATAHLMHQFQERSVEKIYTALVEKTPPTVTGLIDLPIGRDPKQRKRMAVVRDGKPAKTEYEVTDNDFPGGQVLLSCTLLTGRTHQIRVHLAYIGSPVVGDVIYGYRKQRIKVGRQFLHASELAFAHPESGEWLWFDSPLPPQLENTLKRLKTAPKPPLGQNEENPL
ncbi:MAG: RluA family pseudouridine synthase [Phototrophicaceae bacterium]|jgi:23S rRNA pseudouridine1911/1915/1917 synthase